MSPAIPAEFITKACYLPHHCVLKISDRITKIRVVFNGSATLTDGRSLNENLLCGQNILPQLADILTNWRRHRLAVVTDIEKMYSQILVVKRDRDMQRILWRENASEQVQEYCLNTLTYGLVSAPYLALRVIRQLAEDEQNHFPIGAAVLRTKTYVDDILTGAQTVNEVRDLIRELINICAAGGFPLKKWAIGSKLLANVVPGTTQKNPLEWHPAKGHAILGLRWLPELDAFFFKIDPIPDSVPTKRKIFSETAQLFDPLGWLAPVIVRAKILLQSLWLKKLEWDQPLSQEDQEYWKKFRKELPQLKKSPFHAGSRLCRLVAK
ncbi:uncharacterized protein [Cardiocondyla obscurior]|uniref:uncharacterized protein n=1 Tax=Cardiocondyla obscurior TaxID=286306 RepID=UPI0039657E8B